MDTVGYAMDRLGIERPSWQTLTVSVQREVALPAEALWATFTRLGTWPLWSAPMHLGTSWLGEPDWVVGARFEQTLELGFPLGRVAHRVTVRAVEPGRMVAWWGTVHGVRSCHVWELAEAGPGRTRVADTLVLEGLALGLLKPLVTARWRRMFEASVAGLEAAARARQDGRRSWLALLGSRA
jgi:hypothetical protein